MYSFCPGAMNQFTRNLALEWAKDNIRANAVAPGPVMTVLSKSLMVYIFVFCIQVSYPVGI